LKEISRISSITAEKFLKRPKHSDIPKTAMAKALRGLGVSECFEEIPFFKPQRLSIESGCPQKTAAFLQKETWFLHEIQEKNVTLQAKQQCDVSIINAQP